MVGSSFMSFSLGGGGEGSSSQELSFSAVISINRYFPNSFEQSRKSSGNFYLFGHDTKYSNQILKK